MRTILIALGVIVALAKPSQGAEILITIPTANAAGGWYPLGTTLSSIYSKAIPGANITVQATQGSVK
jgi:uncharacterized protein